MVDFLQKFKFRGMQNYSFAHIKRQFDISIEKLAMCLVLAQAFE